MKWIGPLFTNAGGWAAFVSYHNGEWYIDQDHPVKIGKGRSATTLLPILENGYGGNYEHQIALLKSGLKSIDMEEDLANGFPFHVPVMATFESRMSYWANIAVDWLPFRELDNERVQVLFDACQDKVFLSQKNRHAVLKIVNVWAKKRGFSFVRCAWSDANTHVDRTQLM